MSPSNPEMEKMKMGDELRRAYRRANDALDAIDRDEQWNHWATVGESLVEMRNEAFVRARARGYVGNDVSSGHYRKEMKVLLEESNLDKRTDKSTRSRLLELLDNRGAVETWRASLAVNQRREWNHPNTVWRHWTRMTGGAKGKPSEKPKRESPVAKLKLSVIAAEERAYRAESQLRKLDGGSDINVEDSVEEIVAVLSELKLGKLMLIRKSLDKVIRDLKKKKDTGRAPVEAKPEKPKHLVTRKGSLASLAPEEDD